MARFRVHVRDTPNTTTGKMPLIGEVGNFSSFDGLIRHLDVGNWTMNMPANSPEAGLIKGNRGIVVFLDSSPTEVALSGPITSIKTTYDSKTGAVMTVSGLCDNTILDERLGRISPRESISREGITGGTWTPTVFDGAYRTPNNSGEFVWGLLVENYVIPDPNTADINRRVRYLNMPKQVPNVLKSLPADTYWRGFPIRESDISDTVFKIAELIDLVVRFQWDPATQMIVPTIEPRQDVSDSIVFDPHAGNVTSYSVTVERPAATRGILAGATPDTDKGRRYYEYDENKILNPGTWFDPWGRQAVEVEWNTTVEKVVDVRDTAYKFIDAGGGVSKPPVAGSDEAARFFQAAQDFFVENGPKGSISLEAVDIEGCIYGTNYKVGDVVRCLIDTSSIPDTMLDPDGVVRQQVQEMKLSSTASEMWKLTPTIGTADTSSTPYIYRALRRLRRQVEYYSERES